MTADPTLLGLGASLDREHAEAALEAAGYGYEACNMASAAARWPGIWQYTCDRRRAVVCYMPGPRWHVADTSEAEARIAALRRRQ